MQPPKKLPCVTQLHRGGHALSSFSLVSLRRQGIYGLLSFCFLCACLVSKNLADRFVQERFTSAFLTRLDYCRSAERLPKNSMEQNFHAVEGFSLLPPEEPVDTTSAVDASPR